MVEHNQARGPLEIEDAADLLLVLLYAPGKTGSFGEPVEGTTRLQKLFFLLREGEGPGSLVEEAKEFDFSPYKMGPYSVALRDTVEDLKAAGIIEGERLSYYLPDDSDQQQSNRVGGEEGESEREVISYRYRLSEDLGMKIGADLWSTLDGSLQKDLTEFKEFFNSISLRQLLVFTYEKFPDYTVRSTIKDKLGF